MIVTIHRGCKEIGGNCIEVRSDNTRVILDVGLPLFDANRDAFDSQYALRLSSEQLHAQGILPRAAGLFFDDAPAPDAILLSHAHFDHVGLLHHTRPEIPVYATTGTSKMMLAGSVFVRRPQLARHRYRPVQPGKAFQIGNLTITAYSVDHSTFGSVALLIEADGKRLLYSGDLRCHGRKPGMLRSLLSALRGKPIDVLLMEGTHLGREKTEELTEHQLEASIVKQVRSAPGLALAMFSPQDVDRLVTYYRAARRTDRTFVVDAYAAFVLHLVSSEAGIPRPLRRNGIRVYCNASFRRKRNAKLDTLFSGDRIELDEVLTQPSRHLMVFRPSMVDPDFAGLLPDSVQLIHSIWKGYLNGPEWARLRVLLQQLKGELIHLHASGHIYRKDLVELVRKIGARKVVPIHTFEPRELRKEVANVQLLADGELMVVG